MWSLNTGLNPAVGNLDTCTTPADDDVLKGAPPPVVDERTSTATRAVGDVRKSGSPAVVDKRRVDTPAVTLRCREVEVVATVRGTIGARGTGTTLALWTRGTDSGGDGVRRVRVRSADRGDKSNKVLQGPSFTSNIASGRMYNADPGHAFRKNMTWRSFVNDVSDVVEL